MAKETHLFRRPGPRAPRAITFFGDPARGAEREAPTAPHATSGAETGRLSGPARFWDRLRLRIAIAIALAFSVAFHGFIAPWNLLPPSEGIEFKDPEGELSIPVDLIGEEPPPTPEPPPPPTSTPAASDTKGEAETGKPDAGAKPLAVDGGPPPTKITDVGARADDATTDAGADDDAGAGDDATTDAGAPEVAFTPEDAGGRVAVTDAGAAPGSVADARDPESMFGLTKVVNAGVQNVVLGVNVALVRKHPVGARMGPVLQQIPQWQEFLRGAPSAVDPVRDADWILIYGPSLIHTEKDAVLVRYNVPDEAVDLTIGAIARTYDKGGPFDAGVPGVKASLGWADNGQRVFLRPQPKLLVIVPPSHAHEAAVTFRRQAPRGPSPTEAMRLVVHRPYNQISIPGLKFSTSLKELRLWVVPRGDGGAEVFMEGDCDDEAAAADSADRLTELLKRQNSLGVRFATRGLLNNAIVVADGTKIELHVTATADQIEAILQLAAAAVGAQIAPPSGASTPPGR